MTYQVGNGLSNSTFTGGPLARIPSPRPLTVNVRAQPRLTLEIVMMRSAERMSAYRLRSLPRAPRH